MAANADKSARDAQLAAEIQPDVTTEQVAGVYAEAFLGAAQGVGQTEALIADIDAVVAELLDRFPKLDAILASAQVSHEEKLGILDRTLAGRVSPLVVNFLKVLSRHGRLDCLRAVHRHLHLLYDRLRGRVRVRLATAEPIADAEAEGIARRLQSKLGGEPMLERVVDPTLIGGAVMRVGDTIYDGSVATQLQIMRQQMIDRSVHEIQSRRDRFRHPAGN